MRWPTAKRRLVISTLLIGCGLAVCGWQAEEHVRLRRNAAQALINRGRDITSTLGVLLRSQRRFGVVSKDRLQSALQDLVRPGELESIAILGADGGTIASAGTRMDLTPDMLEARGVYWRDRTLTLMNLMDLGGNAGDEGARARTPIVVTDDPRARSFRPPINRRPTAPAGSSATGPSTSAPASTAPSTSAPSTPGSVADAGTPPPTVVGTDNPVPAANDSRPRFGRPPWMTTEEYDAVIQKQGVHSLVIALSTDQMHRTIQGDLLLRSLVSLLAMGGAIASTLAWRNVARNAELQIRLVKAGEMNTHLKEMNLAAAGLAHETRNPLNLIRGLAQMITLQAKEAPKLQEHATAIIEETDRVTVQLNEFINYSKPREPQIGPVSVQRLVADVVRTLVPDIEEKRIHVVQPESGLMIEADEQLLRQALFNVLLNATQAVAPGGHIEVRLLATGTREAVLEVRDDGPGVPAADRATIFKPYVTMRPKGVGLGLAIVSQIAAAHHWDVACDANEPQGAIFRFAHLKVAASPP
jgi:signal transduction histidine kinase